MRISLEQVAGPKPGRAAIPGVAEGVRVGIGPVPVALEQAAAAHPQFPALPNRNGGAGFIAQGGLAEGRVQADRSGIEHRLQGRCHVGSQPDFRHPETLACHHAEAASECATGFAIPAKCRNLPEGGCRIVGRFGLTGHEDGELAPFDAVLLDPVDEATGRELRSHEQGAADQHCLQQMPLRVHVEKRLRRQQSRRRRRIPRCCCLGEDHPVVMAEHAALGEAGRSRGILDVHEIVGLDAMYDGCMHRLARDQPVKVDHVGRRGAIRHQYPAGRRNGRLILDGGQRVEKRRVYHQCRGAGIAGHISDLARRIARVDRHVHGADLGERQEDQRIKDTVG